MVLILRSRGFGLAVLAALALVAAACSAPAQRGDPGVIQAVGAENEYASVISQIGGRYVQVSAVMSNPNTDPHSFEASPSIAREVSAAQLVVQNGLGYDSFMNTIENAAPDRERVVIDVQSLLGLPDSAPNPHLWYAPSTMPAVAKRVARELSTLNPAHAATFQANLASFDSSLGPWLQAIASFKAAEPGAPVAVTEPVADDLLQAAGADVLTPFQFQADVMNGVDPSPQDVALEDALLTGHQVKALLYNQQVADSLTQGFLATAKSHGIPVVGVYETMPSGFTYQAWMLAEMQAVQKAVARGVSAEELP
ncbi:MAG TPA: zinc ABC transporter substrate-binding protein [Actinomycetota bacterium]|nr:zinc ABC transporter substrate-binding protein [Actinomycetota bacterium]